MKRVLVTGATGFLGAQVVRTLREHGLEPIPTARRGSDKWRLANLDGLEWAEVDLLSTESIHHALSTWRPTSVVHCAAYGVDYRQQDLQEAIQANIAGTASLVAASAEAGVTSFVHVGTCYEYGDQAGSITETAALDPVGLYGVTKAAGTLMALERARSLGLDLCVVRPFGMYGPREGSHKLVPMIRRACIEARDLPLTKGAQVRDYVFVRDVTEAIAHLLTVPSFPAGEIFNLGSGRPITLRDFISACARTFGGESLLQFGALEYRPNEMWSVVADSRKWEQFYGQPLAQTSLEEGLMAMAEEVME